MIHVDATGFLVIVVVAAASGLLVAAVGRRLALPAVVVAGCRQRPRPSALRDDVARCRAS